MRVWPAELLFGDAQLFAIQYDARIMEHDAFVNNISDLNLDQLAVKIKHDLDLAQITDTQVN